MTVNRDRGSYGVIPPPGDDALARLAASGARGAESVPLHFFARGPADVTPIPRRTVRTRDGGRARCDWEFRWVLDRVEGTTRSKALARLYDVLLDPAGWVRAGVHWKRVMRREDAHILMRVIPQDTTVCGPGAAGCYSWGGGHPPVAEIGVEYIDRPGPWSALVNMELCGHGTVRADDGYITPHLPYPTGVMGGWEAAARANFRPTAMEVEGSVQWLRGETPPDRVHWH